MNVRLHPGRLLLALAVALPAGLAHAQSSDATPTFIRQDAFAGASGETVYGVICRGCHMADGGGATGAGSYPALRGNPALTGSAYVAITVLQGRGGMPGFGEMLSDEQVAGVVEYVRHHLGNDFPGAITAEEVARLR
ncbi:c-type cytochrome [Coralloluteibacterium stylophorae]|uniref:Cytochrome c n=1 Tax=Coralloluteibacterium stylophorae TaxID=1776034 RepID=A0A8J7VTJ7_9GAMM|nr:cytochrome c [Coralloluteibacterium stylophorae]MBS7456444.1 cytochrome c [Coralloluteibacterium stylophorae]